MEADMVQQHQHQQQTPPQPLSSNDQSSPPRSSLPQTENNNHYGQQQFTSLQSEQYGQTNQEFQKPIKNIHIQSLIDPNDSMHNGLPESPTVGFSNSQTDDYPSEDTLPASMSSTTRTINLKYQLFLDKISPHWKARWAFSLLALLVFMARVVLAQGWYVICYALAIYYLNLLIGFISPKVDPGMGLDEDDDSVGPMLPTNASDEFKPFIRRVPEFKFWISGTKATLLSLFLSLFTIFDVPVFWPILLIYFIILFACTMRQQIRHMIRYSYVPWDSGKKKYTGRGSDNTASLYPETV